MGRNAGSRVGVWAGLVGLLGGFACGETTSDVATLPSTDGGAFDATGTPSVTVDGEAPRPVDAGRDAAQPVDAGSDAADDAGAVYASCKAALAATPGAPDGVYTIDPDGAGAQAPIPVWCDMTTDGGGWTLGLVRNSVDVGLHPTFASGYVGLPALAIDPKVASSVAMGTPALAGWIDLNAFAYTDLVLEGFTAGASTFRSSAIAKATLRIPFGQPGYYLYDDANGYFWCGGPKTYTDDGAGQVDTPNGAPVDCKGHTSLGDGWDFGGAGANTNLTACGGGSSLMKTGPAQGFVGYPTPGAAHAFWVR